MIATILDGPMGTELGARGVATPGPLWSAEGLVHAPGVVAAIHRDYAAAGASVHTANTFRTKRRQAGDGWEDWARLVNSTSPDVVNAKLPLRAANFGAFQANQ